MCEEQITYNIVAIVYKIKGKEIYLKGMNGFLFEKDNLRCNLLSSKDNLVSDEVTEPRFSIEDTGDQTSDSFYREILVRSMLERKALKFELNLENKKLISIELPDA